MMPRKTTTTIEIPTVLLNAIIRHDSLWDASASIERISDELDGKESRDLMRQAKHLAELHRLLNEANSKETRLKTPTNPELLAMFLEVLKSELEEHDFWELVLNRRESVGEKLGKMDAQDQLEFDLDIELSVDLFDLDSVIELTLGEFGIKGDLDKDMDSQVAIMLQDFLYVDINSKGEIV